MYTVWDNMKRNQLIAGIGIVIFLMSLQLLFLPSLYHLPSINSDSMYAYNTELTTIPNPIPYQRYTGNIEKDWWEEVIGRDIRREYNGYDKEQLSKKSNDSDEQKNNRNRNLKLLEDME